jgi:5-methylthioribose kinase
MDLSAANAGSYLAGRDYDTRNLRVTELSGGISNTVLLIENLTERFVLKQAVGRLRVEEAWFSDRSRALREAAALQMLTPCLPTGSVPEILFVDAENCLFAMTAGPQQSRTWKEQLLDGVIRLETAERIAALQTSVMRASWYSKEWEARLGDLTVFGQLRLDPYYRATARRHPDLAAFFDGLIADASCRRAALVHGDWSPKNFLVHGDAVMAIDFEVVHFGDPSFDTAFMLSHLLLKGFHRPEWASGYLAAADRYWETLAANLPEATGWFEAAAVAHLGGLMLARIDGKSPVEYLQNEEKRAQVRAFARDVILRRPTSLAEIFQRRGGSQ